MIKFSVAGIALFGFMYLAYASQHQEVGYTPQEIASVNDLIDGDDWLSQLEVKLYKDGKKL